MHSARAHVTDGDQRCWCGPESFTPCGECEGRPEFARHGCWRCGGSGLVPFDALVHGLDAPVVVVHRGPRGSNDFLGDGDVNGEDGG